MATFQTASLLNIIEQGQKMESVFVGVLLETAMKLSSITDANILVVVDTAHGRKWAGRRSLKDEFVEGRLRLGSKDEEIVGAESSGGNNAAASAQFGGELLMTDLALAAAASSSTTTPPSSGDHHDLAPIPSRGSFASTLTASKPSFSANNNNTINNKKPPPSLTPVHFTSCFKPTPVSAPSTASQLDAPLSIRTTPTPEDDPASSSATSASFDGPQSASAFLMSSGTKLVGSQKRKRRASQTSQQEKKIRGGSAEGVASASAGESFQIGNIGGDNNNAFLKGLEAAEESALMGAEANAKQFLDQVAKRYGSTSSPATAANRGTAIMDGTPPPPREGTPTSDAEVSDLFRGNNNNNNHESKKQEPSINPSNSAPSFDIRGRDQSSFSPEEQLERVAENNFPTKRAASPTRGVPHEDLEVALDESAAAAAAAAAASSAFAAGGNYFQEQIRQMLRAKMSVEDISFHLKIPPSIVTYWVQLIGALPSPPSSETTSGFEMLDKYGVRKSSNFPNVNNNSLGNLFGSSMTSNDDGNATMTPTTTKTTPGRRSGKLDKNSLKQLIDSNKSIREIADILGVHPTTVYRAMKAYDLSLPGHNNNNNSSPNDANKGSKPLALTQYAHVEPSPQQQPQQHLGRENDDEAAAAGAPTGQRVRLKRDRLQVLKNLILNGASVRECASILGVHHTTIYRAMRNLNMDAQAAQLHHKSAAAAHHAPSASGLSPDFSLGSSLLQHFSGFADAATLQRWAADPAAAAMASAAAANYMGSSSSSSAASLASVYNQAALRDLVSAGRDPATSSLDYLSAASFHQPMSSALSGDEGDKEDLNDDFLDDDDDDFDEKERIATSLDLSKSKVNATSATPDTKENDHPASSVNAHVAENASERKGQRDDFHEPTDGPTAVADQQ